MKINTREIVLGAALLALGIIIPTIFHISGINGAIFAPMHIPVLLAGFILGPYIGLLIGFITPILNFMLSGMPPVPMLWIMMFELGLYGFFTGLMYKKLGLNVILSLITSMVIGRLGGASTAYVLASVFGLKTNAIMFLKSSLLVGWPAITIQLILIPVLVGAYNSYNRSLKEA